MGSCSVRSAWIGLALSNLVLTAGLKSHSTLKTTKVSAEKLNLLYLCSRFVCVGKRDIKALKVKCDNVERTCQWEGTVGTLEAHVATCEFTLLPCPKECKDDKNEILHFMRKDLDKHLENDCPNRDHECEYCGEEGRYALITQVHDKICELKILPCPNKCTKIMQRQDIEKHVHSECENAVIACDYRIIGCDTKLKRKDMAAHEQEDNFHLNMAIRAVQTLQKRSRASTFMTFKVSDYRNKKEHNVIYTSPSFYTSSNGYHMAIKVYANGYSASKDKNVSVFSSFLQYDTKLNWPFVGKVTLTLLNQLKDNNHHTKILDIKSTDDIKAESNRDTWGYHQFVPHSELAHDPVKNTQYLMDDTLYFRVSVDIPNHKPWLECTA